VQLVELKQVVQLVAQGVQAPAEAKKPRTQAMQVVLVRQRMQLGIRVGQYSQLFVEFRKAPLLQTRQVEASEQVKQAGTAHLAQEVALAR
jgi:hypothetical protein